MADASGKESEHLKNILIQLFIRRDTGHITFVWKRIFSELILSIPNESGQHLVLETLVDYFPEEAHFWTHLGRHSNYVMKFSYAKVEELFLKAIFLEPEDDYHKHSLGMVYRFEIKRLSKNAINQHSKRKLFFEKIVKLYNKASKCFKEARLIDPESQYNYITNIQLINETIDCLYRSSKYSNYTSFFSENDSIAAWCRNELSKASQLLYKVKALQARDNLSEITIRCERKIHTFLGKLDLMIEGLQKLLDTVGVEKSPIRRIITESYLISAKNDWTKLSLKKIKSIYSLMNHNLEDNPANNYDLILWLNSYRRLPQFEILESIDRLSSWAAREDSEEAHYYLYILHFIRWQQGVLTEHSLVKKHLCKCRNFAGEMNRTRSFEWLGNGPKWCPLVHENDLGSWRQRDDLKPNFRFFTDTKKLQKVNGTIVDIKGPQAGIIKISPQLHDGDRDTTGVLDVFFWPSRDFFKGQDENAGVNFFLGFSYDGLRAWNVQRV